MGLQRQPSGGLGATMCLFAQTAPYRRTSMLPMADFLVLDSSQEEQRVVLLDHLGRCHVARGEDALPPIGTELIGTFPAAAPRVLVAESNGSVFRVTFDILSE